MTDVSPRRDIWCVFESTLAFMLVYLWRQAFRVSRLLSPRIQRNTLGLIPRLVAPRLLVHLAKHRDKLALTFAYVLGRIGVGVVVSGCIRRGLLCCGRRRWTVQPARSH
jgi:hypothetical protein